MRTAPRGPAASCLDRRKQRRVASRFFNTMSCLSIGKCVTSPCGSTALSSPPYGSAASAAAIGCASSVRWSKTLECEPRRWKIIEQRARRNAWACMTPDHLRLRLYEKGTRARAGHRQSICRFDWSKPVRSEKRPPRRAAFLRHDGDTYGAAVAARRLR